MGAWLAQLVEHVTLNLREMSLSPMLVMEPTYLHKQINKEINEQHMKVFL